MSCERYDELADLLLAGEIRERDRELLQGHLDVCPACRERHELDLAVRRSLRRTAAGEAVPALLGRIQTALRATQAQPAARPLRRRAAAIAAAVLLVAVAIPGAWWLARSRAPSWPPARDMVETHLHYLKQKQSPYEVTSSDRQALARWASGRLGRPVRLAPTQWKLLGARMSSVNEHRAALVFYDDGGVRVAIFAFAADSVALPDMKRIEIDGQTCWSRFDRGYHVLIWKDGPLFYGSVSDELTRGLAYVSRQR